MSADPSDRRAAHDALGEIVADLSRAADALERARDLRVVHDIDCDDASVRMLERHLERAVTWAHRARGLAAQRVLLDVELPLEWEYRAGGWLWNCRCPGAPDLHRPDETSCRDCGARRPVQGPPAEAPKRGRR